MDAEHEFPGALVIDEQVDLPGKLTGFIGFQFIDELACSRWQRLKVGEVDMGWLRTEAAIQVSAIAQTEDADRSAGVILQAKDEFAFLPWSAIRHLDVGLSGFQGGTSRRGEVEEPSEQRQAHPGGETQAAQIAISPWNHA